MNLQHMLLPYGSLISYIASLKLDDSVLRKEEVIEASITLIHDKNNLKQMRLNDPNSLIAKITARRT